MSDPSSADRWEMESVGWTLDGAQAADSMSPSELNDVEAELMAMWVPLLYDLGGLLEIAAPGDGGAVESPGKCAVAGAMSFSGCLATAGFALIGVFVCDDIVDEAVDCCTS